MWKVYEYLEISVSVLVKMQHKAKEMVQGLSHNEHRHNGHRYNGHSYIPGN